jgi:hypothetical protein
LPIPVDRPYIGEPNEATAPEFGGALEGEQIIEAGSDCKRRRHSGGNAMTQKSVLSSNAYAALLLGFAVCASPVSAQAPAIQSQDTNIPDMAADFIEAKRSDGVLSVKLRLRNASAKTTTVQFFGYEKSIDRFYVQAEGKKYFMLRDSEKVPLADSTASTNVSAGSAYTWWAKYPAPAANVKKFNFYWPLGAPFDDVPITDK